MYLTLDKAAITIIYRIVLSIVFFSIYGNKITDQTTDQTIDKLYLFRLFVFVLLLNVWRLLSYTGVVDKVFGGRNNIF